MVGSARRDRYLVALCLESSRQLGAWIESVKNSDYGGTRTADRRLTGRPPVPSTPVRQDVSRDSFAAAVVRPRTRPFLSRSPIETPDPLDGGPLSPSLFVLCFVPFCLLLSAFRLSSAPRPPTMLSRLADTLYWMSRYLERAEHARGWWTST